MPKISVVMPVYNGEKYLREAINSVLNQTFKDFDFYIIDDGSTDNTEKLVKSYSDPRIIYLKNDENRGIVYSLNRGIDISTGEYIARMDADDISQIKRFEVQVEYMDEHKNVAVIGSAIRVFGEGIQSYTWQFPTTPAQAKADMLFNSSLVHPSVMIRRAALIRYGLKYEEYTGLEDYVLFWRLAQHNDIVSHPDVLLQYRKHPAQTTKNRPKEFYENYRAFIEERLENYRDVLRREDIQLFERYVSGGHMNFSNEEIEDFIFVLKKVLQKNKRIEQFGTYELRHVCGLAVAYVINSSCDDVAHQIRFLFIALRNGTIPTILFLKILVLKIWKRERK